MRKIKKTIVCSFLVLLTLTTVFGGKMILSADYSDDYQYSKENKELVQVEVVRETQGDEILATVLTNPKSASFTGDDVNKVETLSDEVVLGKEDRIPETSSAVFINPDLAGDTFI